MTRTETAKGERKRTTTTQQNTSNRLFLVEEVTPQILFLSTKQTNKSTFSLCPKLKSTDNGYLIPIDNENSIFIPFFRNENQIFIVNWN